MENKYVKFWLNATLFYAFQEGAAYESYLGGGHGLYFNPSSRKKQRYCFDRLILAIEKIEKSNKEMKNAIEYALDNCVDLIGTEEGWGLQRAVGQEIYNPCVEYDIK